jgi:flagellar basal-body rod modification protein FlgD
MQMMITQLQNQDPLNPTNSDNLMSEMSQIGQMQSTSELQTTLQGLATQTQIGAASSLMGKQVAGLDANSNPVSGLVSSVAVTSSGVNLQLQNGSQLALSNVSTISAAATGS